MTAFLRSFDRGLGAVVLVGALLLAYPFGNIAAYLLMFGSLVLTVRLLFAGAPLMLPGDATAALLLGAFGLLLFAFGFNDVGYVANFGMFVLFGPVSALLARLASRRSALEVASLALAGATIAFVLALFQVLVLAERRAPSYFSDPIWSAQAAVILGFLATIGVVSTVRSWRWVFLLGPVLGGLTTLLAGSRGPLIAVPALTIVLVVSMARRRWRALLITLTAILILSAVTLAFAYLFWPYGFRRLMGVPALIDQVLSGERIAERSTRERLAFYTSSWQAFWHQPWIGYGWDEIMRAVKPYLPDNGRMLKEGHHHLHSDMLDFGVSGGVVGLLAYALVIAAPIAGAWRSVRDSQFTARLLGLVMLSVGYFVNGLTYLTLGYEYGTALYVVLAAILLGFCRDEPILLRKRAALPPAPELSASA